MPCHVVGGVRCQVDHCSLQVCHLSQSTSGDIWQPALHQRPQTLRVDERGVNNPAEKETDSQEETEKERGGKKTIKKKSEGITVQSVVSQPPLRWQKQTQLSLLENGGTGGGWHAISDGVYRAIWGLKSRPQVRQDVCRSKAFSKYLF